MIFGINFFSEEKSSRAERGQKFEWKFEKIIKTSRDIKNAIN
jgi:hypothetical protein